MKRPIHYLFGSLLALLIFMVGAAFAQDPPTDRGITEAELGESAGVVRDLRAVTDKTLIFVFDVSGSMRGQNLARAREATINLIREAAGVGDRLVLLTFGAGYTTVFDKALAGEAEKTDLIEQVPSEVGAGAGTNIRRPHHDALKILDASLPRPGAVVLLTDSFNDEPKRDDPAYADYLRYYTPGGRLARYPDTPENRDYERLLGKVQRSRKVKIYGIGVQIDANGRPVERLPQAAPEPTTPEPTFTPAVTTPVQRGPEIPWLWIALGLGALLLALFALLPLMRAAPLRISGGPAGPKEFQIKHSGTVRLGGDGANFAFDAYPLPGVGTPPALVKGERGQFILQPGTLHAPGVPPPQVFHNGLPLEKPVGLNYGDEVRVSVPDPSGVGVAKEFRLKFEDPKQIF